MAERWFTGKVLSMANGMNMVVVMLGAGINSIVGPEIYQTSRDLNVVVFYMFSVGFGIWLISIAYLKTEEKLLALKKTEDLRQENYEPETLGQEQEVLFTYKHLAYLGPLY